MAAKEEEMKKGGKGRGKGGKGGKGGKEGNHFDMDREIQ